MNIAEHIAYLIGDSQRVVIPIYNNTLPPQPDPGYEDNGDDGIIIDDPMLPDPNLNDPPMPAILSDDEIVGYIKKDVLEKWIKHSMAKISKLVPQDLKLHMTKSTFFTAGQWAEQTLQGIGFDLNNLDSSDIISVSRYDGEIAYDCRLIPLHLRSKSRFGSGFLNECSETDPIYYINNMRIMVEPNPEDTHLDPLDGFCTLDYYCYPDIDVNSETMDGVPFDMQQIVLLSAATKCKKFQLDSLIRPLIPSLDPRFEAPLLDKPDIIDAIDNAKNILNNYSGNSFKDFLLDEDIEMAKTTLMGAKQFLDISVTELTEQDKIASVYLSEYSQNIGNFGQKISEYSTAFKKLSSDYDTLQAEYQEMIYALRGELPNKKQLKDTDKKLEQIKQVVQN
jgi:hypothetical protein